MIGENTKASVEMHKQHRANRSSFGGDHIDSKESETGAACSTLKSTGNQQIQKKWNIDTPMWRKSKQMNPTQHLTSGEETSHLQSSKHVSHISFDGYPQEPENHYGQQELSHQQQLSEIEKKYTKSSKSSTQDYKFLIEID